MGRSESRTDKSGGIVVTNQRELAPRPPSDVVKSVTWAPKEEIRWEARGKRGKTRYDGSDNWPITWADDGHQYVAYGDGYGFDPILDVKLGLGFARIEGDVDDFLGVNIRSPSGENTGHGPNGKKASGLLMVNGVLYMYVRNAGNSQLAWSTDYARTWTWADWKWTGRFGCPTLLNFGPNYADARDEYVYVYSPDHDSAYENADRFILARVRIEEIREREAYSFFTHLDGDGALWAEKYEERGAVFDRPNGCSRSGISYNAGLNRYLWWQQHRVPGDDNTRFRGGFAIYDAPEPWGPWTTVYYTDLWDVGPGDQAFFPTKWMSDDGRTCHLVFSGDDTFAVRGVVFGVE